FGHALCAANAQNRDPFLFLDAMLALKPALFHLTDGDFKGDTDRHLHFGEGDYPIQKLLGLIPKNSLITNEAAKAYAHSLSDFEKDMAFLKSLEGLKS
ncbi:MAG TPA: hypothetical protein PKM26_04045, partial [Syntrophorhabdaceae bacterium]|nr:hypothetical protein [Syntrophorhabdaceae bacterium]